MANAAATVSFGHFRRGPKIATGGMGEVYIAARIGPGGFEKPVALKLLLPDLLEDTGSVQMFLDEARLAARMSHPNVVQLFEVGQVRGRYYMAMELVLGASLAKLIRTLETSSVRLEPAELDHLARSLCDGLHHAHEQVDAKGQRLELVHRDVSPHNVLVSKLGEVKLTDFGIAKARDTAHRTREGAVRGKLEYLAPEQLHGQRVDRRVDVYALGVTLYHAATGVSPFHRDNEGAIVTAILREPLPPLAGARPDLDPALCAAVDRAVAKVAGERFATLLDFKAALSEPSTDGAARLGAKVARHCAELVGQLELAESGLSEAPTPSLPIGRATTRRQIAVGFGVGLVAVALAAAAASGLVRRAPAGGGAEPPPAPAVAEPAPAEPAGAGAERDDGEPAPVAGAPARRVPGILSFDAVPWAVVFVDGRRIGETPIARFPVDKDQVMVVLENPETGKSKSQRVKVRQGKRTSVQADLR